jgi:hypothetical protein
MEFIDGRGWLIFGGIPSVLYGQRSRSPENRCRSRQTWIELLDAGFKLRPPGNADLEADRRSISGSAAGIAAPFWLPSNGLNRTGRLARFLAVFLQIESASTARQ